MSKITQDKYDNIPHELKELKQWCCFKIMKRNGKETKMPINAYDGKLAKSNDETTWANYEMAVNNVEKLGCNGIGFFFKPPYFGIDIDDVPKDIARYKTGDTDNNIVAEFVDIMASYAEVSVSGNGLHIIVKGSLPDGGRRKNNVEMYDSGRFFVMTGDRLGDYRHVADDSDYNKIGYLHNKYIADSKLENAPDFQVENNGNDLTIDEIIRIATNSKKGLRFKLFLEGGWEQFYDSWSEADLAFANDLAFWTNRDYEKMDSIFRESSLYRDKWDEKRGDSLYGEMTLNKAIQTCTNVFKPEPKKDEFNLYVVDENTEEVENKYYSYDDTGNAARFTDNYKNIVRYNYARKNWYYYDGKLWQFDNEGKIKKMVDELLVKMKKEPVLVSDEVPEEEAKKLLTKHIKYSRGSNGKTNMLKESQHLLPVNPETFDKDKFLLNVQNGFIDLKSGTLRSHDREKYFTRISNVEFTDKADHPIWTDFLNQIFSNDEELIGYIQRAVGYSLSGSTEEQMMFILYGNGRNGKSVFLDIITEILGTYSANIQPQSIMIKQQSNNASPDIAKLDGARMVTTTEPNDGMRFDEGLVKQLTGGDKVTARFLHENEFEYEPQFKLWMATNHKPIIRGTDDGIWRRMAIIPFTVQIPEHKVDRNLKYKLRREMNAILNWAVEGFLEWQRIGLKEPSTIKEQRKTYRTEMNPIELFIDECCVIDSEEREKTADVYRVYSSWAKENNYYLLDNTRFSKEMQNKFKRVKNSTFFYTGLRLKKSEHNDGVFRLNLG